MLKKVSIILSIVASLGLAITISAPTEAKPKKKAVVVADSKKKAIVVHKKGGPTYVVGKTYNGYLYVVRSGVIGVGNGMPMASVPAGSKLAASGSGTSLLVRNSPLTFPA